MSKDAVCCSYLSHKKSAYVCEHKMYAYLKVCGRERSWICNCSQTFWTHPPTSYVYVSIQLKMGWFTSLYVPSPTCINVDLSSCNHNLNVLSVLVYTYIWWKSEFCKMPFLIFNLFVILWKVLYLMLWTLLWSHCYKVTLFWICAISGSCPGITHVN